MNPTTTWADHELGLLRVVSGSLKSAADAHPEIQFPGSTRSSAAKRVAAAVVAYLKGTNPINDTTHRSTLNLIFGPLYSMFLAVFLGGTGFGILLAILAAHGGGK